MRVFNHELTVRRNETFTIDKIIENRDGSPYIISSYLRNPYFLITVSDSMYEQENGYQFRAWLPVRTPVFKSTAPINLADFKDTDGSQKYTDFKDTNGLPQGDYHGKFVECKSGDALFYIEKDGVKIYKWWDDEKFTWRNYECRIVSLFTQAITKNWLEKNHYYSIELVSGTSTSQFLKDYCIANTIPVSNVIEEMYEKIRKVSPKVIEGIDITQPLINFDAVYLLLEPTKINVLSNMKGAM